MLRLLQRSRRAKQPADSVALHTHTTQQSAAMPLPLHEERTHRSPSPSNASFIQLCGERERRRERVEGTRGGRERGGERQKEER